MIMPTYMVERLTFFLRWLPAFYGAYMVLYMPLLLACEVTMMNKKGDQGSKALIPLYGQFLFYRSMTDMGLLVWVQFAAAALCVGAAFLSVYLMWFVFVTIMCFRFTFCLNLSATYGKNVGFAVGLTFLAPVFMSLLAFGDEQYRKITA